MCNNTAFKAEYLEDILQKNIFQLWNPRNSNEAWVNWLSTEIGKYNRVGVEIK